MSDPLVVALTMGHRNTNRGGVKGEFDWTPWATRAIGKEFARRGARVFYVQDHDGDSDPSFSVGQDLFWATRNGMDRIDNQTNGVIDLWLSNHYNGGGAAGFHAIFPDGWGENDTKAHNPMDVALAKTMCATVKATETVRLLGWPAAGPGVMSERETGAVSNRQGYRLGEMRASLPWRSQAPRLITEAGSIDTFEREFITNPAWVGGVYAVALADAVEAELGPLRGDLPKPAEPVPVPQTPESVYAKPIVREWMDDAIGSGVPYVDLPDRNHPAGRTRWWRLDRPYITTKDLPRQQVALDDSRFLNEPVPKGTPIWIEFGGENYKDKPHGISPWGTVFDMSGLRPIDIENNPDHYAMTDAGILIGALASTLNPKEE